MAIAYTALILWFFVAVLLFRLARPPIAAALTLLGGTLFLPNGVGVDWPALPEIGKSGVGSIACLVCCMVFAMPKLRRARLGRGPEILVLALAISTVISVFLNLGVHLYGPVYATDFPARVIAQLLRWGVPFVVGRALFTSSRDARDLLAMMAIAAVVYSFFILIELRLSPQLHRWLYGFHQHDFIQVLRESGYRPQVFMRHGLHLSFFVLMALASTLTLVRVRYVFFGAPAAAVGGYLGLILVLCKSLGSIVYSFAIAPLILFASPRNQMRAAMLLVVLVCVYPFARATDVISTASVAKVAESLAGERRAGSLEYRLRNEDAMLGQIQQRLWFGYSNPARAMQREEDSGKVTTVFDGFWLGSLTEGGAAQLACVLGLLLFPVVQAWRAFPRIRSVRDRTIVAGISLMVTINVVDLLPNATTEAYLTLLSGVLAGVVPGILREQARARRRVSPARFKPRAALGGELVTTRRGDLGVQQ